MENRIAGVVVLYNPEIECIKNINSYLDQVTFLYVIDNSETTNTALYRKLILLPKLKYIFNKENVGVARALNQAAELAKQNNYSFLLTMDQDSLADTELVKHYADYLSSNDISKLGILSPVVVYLPEIINTDSTSIKELEVAITSGCLLNLSAYEKAGSFNDKLFIDYVDFEYCLRLRKMGFKIFQLGKAKIYHQLGNLEKRNFIFVPVLVIHHSPERYYYRTRNRLYMAKKFINTFPFFVLKDLFLFVNELLKIIFFEKSKLLKFRMILSGIRDYFIGKYGKL